MLFFPAVLLEAGRDAERIASRAYHVQTYYLSALSPPLSPLLSFSTLRRFMGLLRLLCFQCRMVKNPINMTHVLIDIIYTK